MPWVEVDPPEGEEKLPSVMGTGRDNGHWEEVPEAAIYEAYAGPETGGFGITPAPEGAAEMLRMGLGREGVSPSPFAGMRRPMPPQGPQGLPQAPQRLPLGGGPSVELPIAPPAQALAQAALRAQQPQLPQGATELGKYIPDVGTPGRAGAALGRMWGKTERGGRADAFGHAFVNHGLNALLQVPRFAENLEDNGKQAALWLTEQVGAGSPELRAAAEGAPSVARGWRKIGEALTGGEKRAEDVRAAPELFPGGKSFEDSRAEQLARTQGLALTRPTATAAGDLAATVGEVVGLKRATGATKLMRARDVKLTDLTKQAQEAKLARKRPGGGAEWSQQKISSPGYYKMARGLGRTGETTMEGWLTAALNEGDPMEMAAIAGVGQAGASPIMALSSIKGKPGKGRMMTALSKAAVAGTALAVWELLPGGEEKTSMQSLDSGFDKVKAGIASHIFLGLIGMGRTRTQDWASVNRFTDDISNVNRAGTLAVVERYAGSDDRTKNKVQRVLRTMATRPDSIKPHTLDLLSNGLSTGKFLETIEKLEAKGEL